MRDSPEEDYIVPSFEAKGGEQNQDWVRMRTMTNGITCMIMMYALDRMQAVTERCWSEFGIEHDEDKEELEAAGWRCWKSERDKRKSTPEKKLANKVKTKNKRRRKQLGQRLIRALAVCRHTLYREPA